MCRRRRTHPSRARSRSERDCNKLQIASVLAHHYTWLLLEIAPQTSPSDRAEFTTPCCRSRDLSCRQMPHGSALGPPPQPRRSSGALPASGRRILVAADEEDQADREEEEDDKERSLARIALRPMERARRATAAAPHWLLCARLSLSVHAFQSAFLPAILSLPNSRSLVTHTSDSQCSAAAAGPLTDRPSSSIARFNTNVNTC